jgi:hypothetical protein
MDVSGEPAVDILFDLCDLIDSAMFAIDFDPDFYHAEIIVYCSIYIIRLEVPVPVKTQMPDSGLNPGADKAFPSYRCPFA